MNIRTALLISASLLTSSWATAQEREIEEVVVTAQKREQTLQEVPLAVSVVSGETLERAQINDVLDLQSVVPSLRVAQFQSSANTNFVIRGFGNGANNAGIEPSVGVFVDGVYRSRSAAALADLPNLQRIEVLRGPQSTLFGKNASAGVINITTRAADPRAMDGLSGSAALTAGRFSELILRANVQGALSDTVGFGLSGYTNERDGYVDNLASGGDLNQRSRYGIRGELFFAPTDSLSARLLIDNDEIDEICCGSANLVNGPTGGAIAAIGGQLVPNQPFARQTYLNQEPENEITNRGVSLQIDYDINDDLTLTSITAARNLDRFQNGDVDFTSADFLTQPITVEIDTITQEFRLDGRIGDRATFVAGLYYFEEEVEGDIQLYYGDQARPYFNILAGGAVDPIEAALGFAPGTFFAEGQGVRTTTGLDDETLSLFAQIDIDLSDRTILTLGGNYTTVEKSAIVQQLNTDIYAQLDFVAIGFAGAFGAIAGAAPTPENIAANPAAAAAATAISTTACSATNPPPACNQLLAGQALQFLAPLQGFPNVVEPGTSDDSETTWTLRLAHDATDNMNVYASASTGFKASSWNLSQDSKPLPEDLAELRALGLAVNNLIPGTRFAGPEESTVLELGLKGNWGGNTVNVAIFNQEIEGFQSNAFTGTGFNLTNAGKQSTDGIEIEALWRATDSLDLTFAGTFLDPLYDSFVGSSAGDISGQTPAGIHETSISLGATYYYSLGSGFGFVRADYQYENDIQTNDAISKDISSREVGMLNASLSYTFNEIYEVMLWGRNLNNDDFLITAFPGVAQAGSFNGYSNQPRTYGVTFRTRFE